MLKICLTADYELFFGKNYFSEKEVLIDPTYELLEVLDRNRIPLTIYVDVCALMKYEEIGEMSFVDQVKHQLKFAFKNGHDLQLHLHPHWLYSKKVNDLWVFDMSHYKLQDAGFEISSEGITTDKIIKRGIQYLESICREIDPKYQCISFRAGGCCIQPEKTLIEHLSNNGIKIDSSVLKDMSYNSEIINYNFKRVPQDKDAVNWWISKKYGIAKDYYTKNSLFEVPIGSFNQRPKIWIIKLISKYLFKDKQFKECSRGVPVNTTAPLKGAAKLIRETSDFFEKPYVFSYEDMSCYKFLTLLKYYDKISKKHKKDIYISAIGHPKGITKNDLQKLETILDSLEGLEIKFVKMTDVYNEIKVNKEKETECLSHEQNTNGFNEV